mmetsp:Transcript_28033/g.83777  ORF Transcript_28033/g.83777 Transcript_28033/m.83777 type:complete len:99 (-) Transcript_28033:1784-2080(-)
MKDKGSEHASTVLEADQGAPQCIQMSDTVCSDRGCGRGRGRGTGGDGAASTGWLGRGGTRDGGGSRGAYAAFIATAGLGAELGATPTTVRSSVIRRLR